MRTEIIIKDTTVDLLKEVNLNITKQLIDIQNPEKRKTDRSLTIDIPGSKTNDILFSYIFEVNVDLNEDDSTHAIPHFNPNKKADVVINIDTLQQLKGYCQLKDVIINQENKIIYKIVCFGEIGDLFSKIGNDNLDQLNFSEFDHEYSRENIANSWDTEIIENGVGTPFELGKGYVYPMIDYGYTQEYANRAQSIERWRVSKFFPAVYVKQYIDKIFQNASYTYTSSFLTSDFFKRLIVPFNSDKFLLTAAEAESRLFHVNLDIGTQYNDFYYDASDPSAATPIRFNNTSTPYFDNDTQVNPLTGKFLCKNAGRYSFKACINAQLNYTDGTNKIVVVGNNQMKVFICFIHKSGSTYKQISCNMGIAVFSGTEINSGDTSNSFNVHIQATNLQLDVNDEVFIAAARVDGLLVPPTSGNIYTGWTLETQANSDTWFSNSIADANIVEGDTVPMQQCIPTEIKQRDFLGSIVKAFNLYIEPNKELNNDLIIEPRADYYTGAATDWTEKLDNSKDFTISPMAALDAGEYHFKYKDDEDFLNKDYKTRHDRTYGDHKLKVDNDFVKKINKIELVFAPTPLYKNPSNISTRVLPYIGFFDNKNQKTAKTSKIRLLYYAGMLDTENWNFAKLDTPTPDDVYSQYPYSGHLDHPYNTEFDLNFAPPFEVYYSTTANLPIDYTNQNLYTKYWYSQIKELTDINSKIVEGWFYLTPADIESLSFRIYYFIKDAYYRLLKVENYNPVFSKVTKCTFLKVQEFDAPLQIKSRLHGGRGTFGTDGTIYNIPTTVGTFFGGTISDPKTPTVIVTDTDNNVAGDTASVLLTGLGNYVLSGSERITVLGGGSNTIYPGLTDVTLINSSGVVATESNVLYINNQKYSTVLMGDSITITNSDSPYTLNNTTKTLFCDATEGAIGVSLPTAVNNNGKLFEIIKSDSSANGVTISADGSETINGLASSGLAAQYDTLKIVSNGTEWFKL